MSVVAKYRDVETQEPKTRVQLDLAPAQMERLNWLMSVCEIETRKELVNTALSLLEWVVAEVTNGAVLTSIDRESKRIKELDMPALANARRNFSRIRSTGANE